MPDIFISYRRSDSPGTAGRLADRLRQHYAEERIFRDVESIEAGADFSREILQALEGSSVALVVIGPGWLDAASPDGRRRLDDPEDYVRREIAVALDKDLPLIPVLVGRATMPSADALPEPLRPLALKQALELSERTWDYDYGALIAHLSQTLGIEPDHSQGSAPGSAVSGSPFGTVSLQTYLPDLLVLFTRPQRFLANRNLGRPSDFVRAMAFLALSLPLGELILLFAWPLRDTPWSMVPVGSVVWLLLVLMLSVPFHLAWRIAGAPPGYQRSAINFFYQSAILSLLAHLGLAFLMVSIGVVDPQFGDKVLGILHTELSAQGRFGAWSELVEGTGSPVINYGAGAALLAVFGSGVWLWMSWGAYRILLGLSRWRSVAAFLLFPLLVAAGVAGVAWLGA
ncbi:MAG TPA: toll/interleukin-1 receptor domain-containing protein [Burkholderiales bacterium]|nr:toll/interleukin-1 receptor domain-containing protein [Burkholderiales bacterium]